MTEFITSMFLFQDFKKKYYSSGLVSEYSNADQNIALIVGAVTIVMSIIASVIGCKLFKDREFLSRVSKGS